MKSKYLLFVIPFLLMSCQKNNVDDSLINGEYNYVRLEASKETYYSFSKNSYERKYYMPSTGNANILVVPLIIEGYEENATEENRQRINYCFFGDYSSTGFESVSSYYKKSSFSKLNISGEVLPWMDIDMSPSDILNANNSIYNDYGTFTVVEKIYEKLMKENFDFSNYDVDNNGYIDALYIVYSCPSLIEFDFVTSSSEDNPFWAFTYVDYNIIDDFHDENNIIPHLYCWTSFDTMNRGSTVGIYNDAHTFIHETGHLLGLVDYYDYDSLHSPLGCFDMEDYNVGDHNAYSKYALGWINPILVTGDSTITISPATKNGDAIIVKDPSKTFSNSAFDEYLILELLTPDGLWTNDSNKAYPGVNNKTYTIPGIRIIHVDARVRNASSQVVYDFTNQSSLKQMCSNTPSKSYSNITSSTRCKYDLLAMIPASNSRIYQTSATAVANNNCLFSENMVFTSGDYEFYFNNGKLHNGEDFPFKITFNKVSSSSATISFKIV
ncbi:MAG: hypothetical protein ACI31G_00980 [Bacilli bacterium]